MAPSPTGRTTRGDAGSPRAERAAAPEREPAGALASTGQGRRRRDLWLAACIALATVIASVDAILGHEVVAIGLLVVVPLLAATRLGPGRTALVAGYALAAALVLDATVFADKPAGRWLPPTLVVLIGGALATWIAALRTRLEVTRRWTQFLAEAGTALGAAVDYGAMLEAVVHLPVPTLADFCVVDVIEPDGTVLRRAAMVHDDGRPGPHQAIVDHGPRRAEETGGTMQPVHSGEAVLVADARGEELRRFARDEEHFEFLRELGLRSLLVVPLRAGTRTLGSLGLATSVSERRYGPGDVAHARSLAARASLALERARLYDELREAQVALRASRDELEAILEGVADGITATDEQGRLVYANAAAVRAMGLDSAADARHAAPGEIAARYQLFTEGGDPFPAERLPGRRALRGETPEPTVVRFRPQGGGEERWSVVKASVVRRADGSLLAISVIEDVTEAKRAEQAQRFLARAGELLGSSLDHQQTLRDVASAAVPDIADWCTVDVATSYGALERVALAHVDPAKLRLADELRRAYPEDPTSPQGAHAVARTGEPVILEDIPDEMLFEAARDERHLELLREIGLMSAVIVPMVAPGRIVGTITLVTAESGRRFDQRDLELALELGRRAGLAVDNARLYGERAYIAQRLQESLLPPSLPDIPGVEVAARFRAAGEGNEVGGDFYDVFQVGETSWMVVIGDVCGKGADAAAITAQARYTLRAAAAMGESVPCRMLAILNEAIVRQRDDDQFCTVACARLDLGTGPRLTVCSGGHPLPLLLRRDGRAESVGRPGTLLGVVEDPELVEVGVDVHPGDSLVLYTDGVTEARAPERVFGPAELAGLVERAPGRGAAGLAAGIEREALALRSDAELRDDVAILVVRMEQDASAPARSGGADAGAPAKVS